MPPKANSHAVVRQRMPDDEVVLPSTGKEIPSYSPIRRPFKMDHETKGEGCVVQDEGSKLLVNSHFF